MGLVAMRERFEELGGNVTIISQEKAGFTVRAWLPPTLTPSLQ
jgi:signal transduction histidine kinase